LEPLVVANKEEKLVDKISIRGFFSQPSPNVLILVKAFVSF
jgi:hypothetical protein